MTGFDRELASRVAAFLAGQHCITDVSTALGIDTVWHSYPEIGRMLGPDGFDRPAEAWEWVESRMSRHRVTMGEIQAQLMGRRYAQRHTEEDGA